MSSVKTITVYEVYDSQSNESVYYPTAKEAIDDASHFEKIFRVKILKPSNKKIACFLLNQTGFEVEREEIFPIDGFSVT